MPSSKYVIARRRRNVGRRATYRKRTTSKAYANVAKHVEKNTSYTQMMSMPRFNIGLSLPTKKNIVIPYVSPTLTVTSTIGGLVGVVESWNLNSMYDPYVGVGGTQPRGFDQWMAFYKRYKVFKTEVRVRAIPPVDTAGWGTLAGTFCAFSIKNSSQGTPYLSGLDYSSVMEKPQMGCFLVDFKNQPGQEAQFTIDMAQVEGRPLYSDNYTGSSSGSPGNLIQIEVGCGNAIGTNSVSLAIIVELIFHATLYERENVAVS